MSPIYNPAYTKGLSICRLRVDAQGRIVEAEGYDRDLRRWCYRCEFVHLKVEWNYE